MGAWSYEVLSNDRALDTMWDLVDSKNLKEDIIKLLENGDTDEKVLACEIVDISINGVDEEILGGLYEHEEFFEKIIKIVDYNSLTPSYITEGYLKSVALDDKGNYMLTINI